MGLFGKSKNELKAELASASLKNAQLLQDILELKSQRLRTVSENIDLYRRYNMLEEEYRQLAREYQKMKYNEMAKGNRPSGENIFTKKELKMILQVAHVDKTGSAYNAITAKLIELLRGL